MDADIFAVLLFAFVVWLYFVPAMVAYMRRHHHRLAILVLNFFLGWSVIGWVIALVWACTATREQLTRA